MHRKLYMQDSQLRPFLALIKNGINQSLIVRNVAKRQKGKIDIFPLTLAFNKNKRLFEKKETKLMIKKQNKAQIAENNFRENSMTAISEKTLKQTILVCQISIPQCKVKTI